MGYLEDSLRNGIDGWNENEFVASQSRFKK